MGGGSLRKVVAHYGSIVFACLFVVVVVVVLRIKLFKKYRQEFSP